MPTFAVQVSARCVPAGALPARSGLNVAVGSSLGSGLAVTVILIVEDDAFTREMLEMTLKDAGYQTVSAGDVDEALVFLESAQDIDVLVTDIYLKTAILGGCELARKAVAIRPTLRVLYTTGNFVTAEMQALFIEGTSFLRKPYTGHQLQHSLETLLAA
jgi:CheY-like chemotaxis protein